MIAFPFTCIALSYIWTTSTVAQDEWESCHRTDASCQLTLEDETITDASISLLQYRGEPTKVNYNNAVWSAADVQDTVARLRREEAETEKTLADLQKTLESPTGKMAPQQTSSMFAPAAEPPLAQNVATPLGIQYPATPLAQDVATPLGSQYPATPMVSQPWNNELVFGKSLADMSVAPSLVEPTNAPLQSRYTGQGSPLADMPAGPLLVEPTNAPLPPRSHARSYSESLSQTSSQEQGSSAMMNRLVSAELAQTQALNKIVSVELELQARQDALENRQMQLELDRTLPSCAAFSKSGCGPIGDQMSCNKCCYVAEGMSGALFSASDGQRGSTCACKSYHKLTGWQTICTSHSVKTVASILTMMGTLAVSLNL